MGPSAPLRSGDRPDRGSVARRALVRLAHDQRERRHTSPAPLAARLRGDPQSGERAGAHNGPADDERRRSPGYDALSPINEEGPMPTRTQTSKRAAGGRFGRTGKAAHRTGGGRRPAASRRPTMTMKRRPEPSGAPRVFQKLGSLFGSKSSRRRKRGAAGGRRKKGAAGVTLLAGAAGLAMKNRDKLASKIRGRRSADHRTS
jgi:hypothetical protein